MSSTPVKKLCKVTKAMAKLKFNEVESCGRVKLVGVSRDSSCKLRSFAYIANIPYGDGRHQIAAAQDAICMEYLETKGITI